MNLDDVIRRRRMVRAYAAEPVDPQVVDELIEYARRAPSAGFTQGVSFLVLREPGSVRRYWDATTDPDFAPDSWLRGMMTAPVLIVVFCSKDAYFRRYTEADKGWDAHDQPWSAPYWYVDAGMAAEHILLGAVDKGLGACFFGAPESRIPALKAAFGVPDEQLFVGVVSLGHPADGEQQSGSPRKRARKDPSQLVHQEQW